MYLNLHFQGDILLIKKKISKYLDRLEFTLNFLFMKYFLHYMSETKDNAVEVFANEFMNGEGLKGKPTLNKIIKIIENIGLDKEKVKEAFLKLQAKEEFANDVMAELGIKGKATRIKIMRIIDMVGDDKSKIKTAFLRSTITDRIHHD